MLGVGRDDAGTIVAESEVEMGKWHTREILGAIMRTVGYGVERSAKQQTHMHVANTQSLEKAMWVFTRLGALQMYEVTMAGSDGHEAIWGSQTHILPPMVLNSENGRQACTQEERVGRIMCDVQHSMHVIYHCSTVLHDSTGKTALEDSVLMPSGLIIYS